MTKTIVKAFRTIVDPALHHDGYQMTFANGCTISVMFGQYTYSNSGETTAEVAAWRNDGPWLVYQEGVWIELPKDSTEIMARQTSDEVANLIFTLSQYK